MEKTFEMNTKRVISYLQVVKQYPNIVVYKDEEFVDGELIKSAQGIASLQHIQSLGKNSPIKDFEKEYKTPWNKSTKGAVMARRNHMREELRKTGNSAKWKDLRMIEYPYDVIEAEGTLDMENLGEFEVFYRDYGSHLIESLDEKRVPQAMHFNYMNGNVHNGYFNLENVLDGIKERTDIEWLNRAKEAKISDIPHYNSEEGRDEELDFHWIPSDEDYAKITFENRWYHQHEVMKKIFGLDLSEEGMVLKRLEDREG